MKNNKNRILAALMALALFTLPSIGRSEYAGNLTPLYLYGAKTMAFGVDLSVANVCNYFGRHFRFDATTPEGKNMLAILLTAISTKRKIDVWYTASTAPGTDNNSGCTFGALAVITSVGIK
ncbi:MAG: hypothetical protein OEZ68_00660 [Gammaproteobacteria bacterium]|nr:hypothetical protein [Gammaproteobacteria bacterium]MDH5799289.1 hypothetical protein [Gammaproteobacteria bacterium]